MNENKTLFCYIYYYDRVHLTKLPPHFTAPMLNIRLVDCKDCLRYYNKRYKGLRQFWEKFK